jgi:cytochrome c oxidase subunit 3
MASTIHEPLQIRTHRKPDERHAGNGGWRNLVPADGDLRAVEDYSPAPSRTGIWVGVAAITMSFVALTSAMIVRQGAALDWRHLAVPPILYFNTLVLLASSISLEVSRRRIAVYMGGLRSQVTYPARWLYVTLLLGILFVAGQYAGWRQLTAQGLYLATNPSSSFFYVLTAAHALHVLGGLGGLVAAIRKLSRGVLRRSTLDVTSYYWHFMDVLWLYLLLLLWTKF